MMTAKLFENGRSQAVRLPKEYRFNGDEVAINKVGDIVILMPKENKWSAFLEQLFQHLPVKIIDVEDAQLTPVILYIVDNLIGAGFLRVNSYSSVFWQDTRLANALTAKA